VQQVETTAGDGLEDQQCSAQTDSARPAEVVPGPKDLDWALMGPQGLRAGVSAGIFVLLLYVLVRVFLVIGVTIFAGVVQARTTEGRIDPVVSTVEKTAEVLALLASAGIMAVIERRRLADFYLRSTRLLANFFSGLCAGFLALSVLVGAMTLGGWMHFGPAALSGRRVLLYAVLWSVAFLLVAFTEEGVFRCYLQFTLTRGISFWWALAANACICAYLLLYVTGNGVRGVYLVAGLALLPCLWLYLSKAPRSGFWQAAWVTSTLFGAVHTGNNGENWIGIFAAGAIGFVFCVSVYVTGSAWWAIGCHASWDWAETYFYGTADSGLVARGHLLTATPAGNPLWSGGTDGPEGSLLVLAVILLLLVAVLALYGRMRQAAATVPAAQQAAG
jgi:membrane protease YdiL (CAAX protease family)